MHHQVILVLAHIMVAAASSLGCSIVENAAAMKMPKHLLCVNALAKHSKMPWRQTLQAHRRTAL